MFAFIATTIILILSILTYALRLYCRKKAGQRIQWDDTLMSCRVLISIETAIRESLRECLPRPHATLEVYADLGPSVLQNGLGHHICRVPIEQRKPFAIASTPGPPVGSEGR